MLGEGVGRAGGLPVPPTSSTEPTLPADTQEAVKASLRDGGYDEAVARMAVEDPGLANQ